MSQAQSEDLVFYYAPQSRSIVVDWMLGEVGVPFTRRTLDLQKGDQRQPDYLAINPMGKVPSITHKGVPVSEVAAICTYLADAFPDAGMSFAPSDSNRGPYLKWLFFGPGCLEPAITDRMFQRPAATETAVGYGSYERVMKVVDDALTSADYLVGNRFSTADVVIGSNLAWAGLMLKAIELTPAMQAYMQRLQARPALQKAFAT